MIRVVLSGALLATACTNHCETLASQICDKAGTDLDTCRGAAQAAPGQADPCDKIRAVTLSCETLRKEADKATREDLEACKADLDLIRELTKQQE